jgi:hypothetical protein
MRFCGGGLVKTDNGKDWLGGGYAFPLIAKYAMNGAPGGLGVVGENGKGNGGAVFCGLASEARGRVGFKRTQEVAGAGGIWPKSS